MASWSTKSPFYVSHGQSQMTTLFYQTLFFVELTVIPILLSVILAYVVKSCDRRGNGHIAFLLLSYDNRVPAVSEWHGVKLVSNPLFDLPSAVFRLCSRGWMGYFSAVGHWYSDKSNNVSYIHSTVKYLTVHHALTLHHAMTLRTVSSAAGLSVSI